jgi:cytidylate kinase
MAPKKISIEQLIKEQIQKWKSLYDHSAGKVETRLPVITISLEPGAGGSILAKKIAARLGFDLFNREIIEKIAKSTKTRSAVIETVEKERLAGIKDFISSLIEDQYIHPDLYLEHLFDVVGSIGGHGRAVIVGRGANFILPPERRFSVRVVAPLEIRVQNIVRAHGVSADAARRRIIARESRRSAFIRRSFNANISNPHNYDLVINTGKMSLECAEEAVIGAVMRCLETNG